MAFTYYGISLNITGFGLSLHLTQFLFVIIEMPMKIGVYFLIEKIGRRAGEMGALLSTGLCLFINIFVPRGYSFSLLISYSIIIKFWLILYLQKLFSLPAQFFFSLDKWIIRTIVAVLGKSLSEGSFTIIFLFTAELYPTVVRSVSNNSLEQV